MQYTMSIYEPHEHRLVSVRVHLALASTHLYSFSPSKRTPRTRWQRSAGINLPSVRGPVPALQMRYRFSTVVSDLIDFGDH